MVSVHRRVALQGLLAATAGATLGIGEAAGAPDERRVHGPAWAEAHDFVDRIGVNVHLGHRGTPYDREFDTSIGPAIQDLGLTRIRDDAYVPVPGVTDIFYGRVRALARMGCRFSAVCYDPTNAYVTTAPQALPRIFDSFEGAVDMFEGGNEPQLVADRALNPTLSWLHQRDLHDTIRRDLSGTKLSLASPSYVQGSVALAKPLKGLAERSNLHPYPGMEHPETLGPGRLAGFREAMKPVCGGIDAIVTETGYHTAVATQSAFLPVSEAIRARYLPRLLLHSHLSGMQRTFLYELRSSFDRGPADPESAFGLLAFDGRPTPGYQAVKRLVALFSPPRSASGTAGSGLSGPRAIITAGDHADVMAAAFRRADGRHLLPIWLAVSGWDPGPRTARAALSRRLRLEAGEWRGAITAHRFEDDGGVRREPVTSSEGTSEIAISDRLTVLEFGT